MKKSRLLLGMTALICTLTRLVQAADVGNLDCDDAEYFKPFGFIENSASGPGGTNVGIVADGYFIVIFAPDSGLPPGEIGVYDISNPKEPVEQKHIKNSDTQRFREAHSLPVALVGDKEYVAIQTGDGIQIWDISEPVNMSRVAKLDLDGIDGGDYDNVAWQATWQGRYLYVAGSNQGVYIIDTIDPTSPKLLKRVANNKTGGFRVGPLYAMGDYLVVSNMDQRINVAVLDISRPDEPALLGQKGSLPNLYTTFAHADRIYGSGRDGSVTIHSFEDPTEITALDTVEIGGDSLYVARHDNAIFSGNQEEVVKVDITDEQNPKVVGKGSLGREHPDHGQVTPLGNLVYVGNDHGTGSAFFCHQRGKDTNPPEVQRVYPASGSTGVPLTSRISIAFSDYIDTRTVSSQTISLRPLGGEPLAGIYTLAFNTLSFGARESLKADQTYEIVITTAVKDVMGNALAKEIVTRFSTGDSIDDRPSNPEPEPSGGAGGSSSASGGAASASGGRASSSGGLASSDAGGSGKGGVRANLSNAEASSEASCDCGIARRTTYNGYVVLAFGLMMLRRRKLWVRAH